MIKLRERLSGWKAKLLSNASRLELIKSTLSSMHVYWASSFLLPKAYVKLMDRNIRNFFWGHFENKKYFTSITWKTICRPLSQRGPSVNPIRSIAEAVGLLQAKYVD